jgi:hypothetical protein
LTTPVTTSAIVRPFHIFDEGSIRRDKHRNQKPLIKRGLA